MKPKHIVITASLALILNSSIAQMRCISTCKIINTLINSKEVNTWFKDFNRFNDSTIVFLDPNNLMSSCNIEKWKGTPIRIIAKGELIDSLGKFDLHHLLKNRFNYYLIKNHTVRGITTFYLHRGFDNLVSSVKLKKKDNGQYLDKIKSSVL